MHFDLIATEPNHGIVWFDDVHWERLASNFPEPPLAQAQCGHARGAGWMPGSNLGSATPSQGTCRLLVYCESSTGGHGVTAPRATPDSEEGHVTLDSLDVGREYRIAAVAVNADGKRSALGPDVRATVADRQAPGRAGSRPKRRNGHARVSWSPHALDRDIVKVHVGVAGQHGRKLRELATIDAQKPMPRLGRSIAPPHGQPLMCNFPTARRRSARGARIVRAIGGKSLGPKCCPRIPRTTPRRLRTMDRTSHRTTPPRRAPAGKSDGELRVEPLADRRRASRQSCGPTRRSGGSR